MFAYVLEFMLTFDKMQNVNPLLTARYTILCTRRLQPPSDDCAVRVQWVCSVSNRCE